MLNAYPKIIENDLKLKVYKLASDFFFEFRENFGCCGNYNFTYYKRKELSFYTFKMNCFYMNNK